MIGHFRAMPEPKEASVSATNDNQQPPATEGEESGAQQSKVPPGIVPLFLSSQTQQIFECVCDEHVSKENPNKLIPKEKFAEDIQNRAAVSDFQPLKKKIKAYPGDELLLVYDYDFIYEQNFYLCITEEAKELILNPPTDAATEKKGGGDGGGEGGQDAEEEDEPIPCTPEPKEWICLGSDKEIKEGDITETRPLFKFTLSKKRRYFALPCSFSTRSSSSKEGYVEVSSVQEQQEEENELNMMEIDCGTQAVPVSVDVSCQTKWPHPVNVGIQYEPRLVSTEEAEETMTKNDLREFMEIVAPRVELALQQNEIMDIFYDDYVNLADDDGIVGNKTNTNLKEYQSFTDLRFSKDKQVTYIDWHPTIKGIVAVACGENYSFEERIELSFRLLHSRSLILIWSFADPIHPQLFLEAPEDILCFKFNPSNPNLIVGGCINGQLVVWDITEHQDRLQINKASDTIDNRSTAATMAIFETDPKLDHAPIVKHCVLSSIDGGHKKAVSELLWVPDHMEVCHKTFKVLENTSNYCTQIISCGLDGNIMFWDTHPSSQKKTAQTKPPIAPKSDNPFHYLDLIWKPFLKIPLPRSASPGTFAASRVNIVQHHKTKPRAKEGATEDISGDNLTTGSGGVLMPYELPATETTTTEIEDSPTLYCVGTDDGEFVQGSWMPTRDSESGKTITSRPSLFFNAHCGSVCCAERSPFFRDIILTVGGWNFCIWKQGNTMDALLKSGSSQVNFTGGTWSPTRPGVFFIAKQNGNIDVWDLMDRSHTPSLAQNISSLPITSICLWSLSSRQLMLAVGDSGGTLHILEVPWNLVHATSNEASVMEAFFSREVQRLEFVSKRASLREAEKKQMDTAKENKEQEDKMAKDKEEKWEEDARKDYQQYLAMENALLIELGLRNPPKTDEDK